MIKYLSLAIVISSAPIRAQAQAPDCAAPKTQLDMNDCASRAYASADAHLNQVWKTAISSAKGRDADLQSSEVPSAKMLRDAQRSWILFRDQACLAESTVARGGSLQPLIQYVCLERLTLNRIEDLSYFNVIR